MVHRTSGLGRVLRNRQFLALWIAQLLSQLSFHMINFSLITQIFFFSASSLAVSFLVLAIGLPALIFGLIAGPLIDRWGKKRTLVATNALRAVAVLGFFYVSHSLLGIYAITFVVSAITQFFAPAESATLPELVHKKDFSVANSLFIFTLYGAFILGYSIAGPLQHLGGESLPLTLAAIFYLVSAVLVSTLSPTQRRSSLGSSGEPVSVYNVIIQMRQGLALIRNTVEIWVPIIQLSIAQAVTTAVFILAPAFSESVLHISVRDASYILVAPAGLGIITGALLLPRIARRFKAFKVISAGMLAAGISLIFVASINNGRHILSDEILKEHEFHIEKGFLTVSHILSLLSVVGVGVFAIGFSIALITISSQTLLQERTTSEMRSRTFAVLNVLINIAGTFPILLVGLAADLTSADTVLGALGFLLLIWAVAEILLRRKRRKFRKKLLTVA
jgi:MFS family permease